MNSYFPAPPMTWESPSLDTLLSGAFQTFPLGLGILSPGGDWLMVNPALCELLETPPRELADTPLEACLIESHTPLVARVLEQFEEGKRDSYCGEVRFYTRDGEVKKARLAISTARVPTKSGAETSRFLLIQMTELQSGQDQSELLELENEKTLLEARVLYLETQLEAFAQNAMLQAQTLASPAIPHNTPSLTAPLTGFYSRTHLERMLDTETHRCARSGDRFCLLAVRLSDSGGATILGAADILRARLRRSDVLFDLENGDFAALLPSTSQAGGDILAQTFTRKLGRLCPTQSQNAQWDGLEVGSDLLKRAFAF